jgi:predicted peptidase
MKKFLLLAVCLITLQHIAIAQNTASFSKEVFINGSDTLLYRMLLPENFDASKKYPVVVFLHGAGERGNDNEAQLTHGSKLFLNEQVRKDFPAVVIFPQCPTNDFWANILSGNRFEFQKGGKPFKSMKALLGLVDDLRSRSYADKDRFYAGGLSMGGMGTLELLRRKPKVFAAAIAICGGDNIANAKKYKRVPLWFFHGAKDTVVPPAASEVVVAELQRLKADVKLTIYPEATHNSWDKAFAEPELLPWLFSHKK